MKRLFLLLTVVLITAQLSGQKVSLGPELGLNAIPLENTDYGYNFQMGLHIGMQVRFQLSDHFNLLSGISLTQKKKKYSSTDTSSIFEYYGSLFQLGGIDEQEVDSIASSFGANTDVIDSREGVVTETLIEIPLLLNYNYKNFNLYAGPYFGFLLNGKFNEITTTEIPLLNVVDISQFDSTGLASAFLPEARDVSSSSNSSTDGLRKIDIGMNLGIGYQMNQLHFNLFYSRGFLNYSTDEKSGVTDDEKDEAEISENATKSSPLSTFRFSIVYLFDLTKKEENSPRIE